MASENMPYFHVDGLTLQDIGAGDLAWSLEDNTFNEKYYTVRRASREVIVFP